MDFFLLAGLSLFSVPPETSDRAALAQNLQQLQSSLSKHRNHPCFSDGNVFLKGAEWALRHDARLGAKDLALVRKALERGRERIAAIATNRPTWPTRKGKLVRGYVSRIDGSTQPFGLIIPKGYDPKQPIRLDVVLHGSSRPAGMSELRFMNRFDEGDGPEKSAPRVEYIELHPLGRVENCYRWAGETDVFEAIEAVCRSYNIDRDRIVLRGMSMGASGTWHLGLKHPDRFVALGPYCGYVDTHQFSKTPLSNFIQVGPLPEHQEKTLHMLDSIDYAANAGVTPAIACIGEKDVFFQAHVIMGQAMKKEGLEMVNLISPGTGHVVDPKTFAEQMRRIKVYADKGLNHRPKHLRFVTWTVKYGKCHWLEIQGLEEHYKRAEIEATIEMNNSVSMKEPINVTRFALNLGGLAPRKPGSAGEASPHARLKIGGRSIPIPATASRPVIGKANGQWEYRGELGKTPLTGKRPGLQGPIDDAFSSPFLCVRGTGKPWNPAIQAWSEANLKRFAQEWDRYFRGKLPVKDDTAVTEADIARCNLILFGDPGSNPLMARVLPRMPLKWDRNKLQWSGKVYPSADHAPILIQPNPLAPGRYVVFNSGHTFHEKELASLNYLLFPRLGDWTVMRIGGDPASNPRQAVQETPVRSGFFDENWGLGR